MDNIALLRDDDRSVIILIEVGSFREISGDSDSLWEV